MKITIKQAKHTLIDTFKVPNQYLSRLLPRLTPSDSEVLQVCAAIDTGLDTETACLALKLAIPTEPQMRTFTRNLARYIADIATARGDDPLAAMSGLFADSEVTS